ncbi:P-loop NTPase fold protein [Photobacterium profundum]|uniref:KAP NTPase domain-containing protein n=1 Tax=Photobacterium profundum 3TCK TaxID=314280 RepID=Q1Z9E4_9GAMM|nr:P-loop NTPase fold protein [Photobacterium profundum]EAS44814.1 hypothetical protein P3TCK_20060 [Photobacterium profundum 3TCK]
METINKYLHSYIDLESPQYAVLITGGWGTGKTFFIKNFLKNLPNDAYCYISLYGVKDNREIDSEIFSSLFPLFKNKSIKLATKIAKGILSGALRIKVDDDVSFSSSAKIDISGNDIASKLNKKLWIFDDLERSGMHPAEALAYINNLVEHEGCNVIVISDESKLKCDSSVENCDLNSYSNIKEKTIGKTFKVKTNIRLFIENLTTTIQEKSPVTSRLYKQEIKKIISVSEKAEITNLRVLKKVLIDFDFISSNFSPSFIDNHEAIRSLFYCYFPIALEYTLNNNDALFEGLVHGFQTFPEDSTEKKSYFKSIITKYGYSMFDSNLSPDDWKRIIVDGHVDYRYIEGISYKRYIPDGWEELWELWGIKDEELNGLIERESIKLEKATYSEVGQIKHLIALFYFLDDKGVGDLNIEKIISDAKNSILYLSEEKLFDYINSRAYDSAYKGRVYFDSPRLSSINDFIDEVYLNMSSGNMEAYIDNFLFYTENDIDRLDDMLSEGKKYSSFKNRSILNKVKAEDFLSAFKGQSCRDINKISKIVIERYNRTHQNPNLKLECGFYSSLLSEMKVHLEQHSKSLSSIAITDFIISLDEAISKNKVLT